MQNRFNAKRKQQRITMESNLILNPGNPNRNLTNKSLNHHLQGAMLWLAAYYVLTTTVVLMLMSKPIDAYRNNSTGVLFTNAQYSHGGSSALVVTTPCEFERLRRCQQDIVRDMQLNQGAGTGTSGSLESVDVQYSISSGPPYSPIQQAKQLASQRQLANLQTTCRLVRANLACIISATPACYDAGIQSAQNTDYILRAKRFLEINGCNGPDQTWQGTICYRAPEAQTCEERYGLPATTTTAYSTTTSSYRNLTSCLAYNAFRYCIETHLRGNCRAHEIDMINEYLIDHAGDLTWRCPLNGTAPNTATLGALQASPNPYGLSDHLTHLAPSSYEQRPTYVGQSAGITILNPSHIRDQPWERFNDVGISRRPGEVFDRLVAAAPSSGFDIESTECQRRVAPLNLECEDKFETQRSRTFSDDWRMSDPQKRLCCPLFQYRDCVARAVIERCTDLSPSNVDIIMGTRRREMAITCFRFNRDICSGALAMAAKAFGWPVLTIVALLASFLTTQLSHKTHSNLF